MRQSIPLGMGWKCVESIAYGPGMGGPRGWSRNWGRGILYPMAADYGKSPIRQMFATLLAVVLALHGVSPCFADCGAVAESSATTQPDTQSAVPACHAAVPATTPAAPKGSAHMDCVGRTQCCCITEPLGRSTGEAPVLLVARANSDTNFEFAQHVERAIIACQIQQAGAGDPGTSAPPGAPLFIAHHALLI